MANLPPALLARLQRRGIVPGSNKKAKDQEPEEEVIAEDYDDPAAMKGSGNGKDMAPGCPNKYNVHHDCSDFCFKHWGQGEVNPPPTIQRKYNKILKKYPLPANWQQVWEPGLVRYYFWNTVSDEVSWLPPGHPEAKISLPVPKLKARLKEEEQVLQSLNSDDDEDGSLDEDSNDSESDMSSYDSMESEEETKKKQKTSHHRPTSPHSSNRYRGNRSKNLRNDLDPMDPASYSDSCPRGRWSDGLETKVKAGADATVTGTAYQARPYPNPGAVLRMNKS
ncbi:polyglutamine-binding protein 1 [Tetranychus urticae]|uniref:Polyglutamine-binding protein 1 n=1 Tax=Tetranychus urticae TaxID=32264 RepID=T1L017_TETUR|nr:polyglutamine-binding protein 1 [Tetranychus urticae]